MNTKVVFPEESYKIVGACFEVYREKGCGFVEAVYQEWAIGYELVEKLQQSILWLGGRAEFVTPSSQITADMLGRRASSSHPPRSQSEMPHFFNRL